MNDIALEINGVPYSGFTSATASKSMEHISGSFSFNISVLDNLQKFPIQNRSKCRVLVNGKAFITGYVETIGINYDSKQHQITIGGRDKTCDIIDNTLGSELSFSAGISLENIIRKVLKNFGLENEIAVNSNAKLDVFDNTELNNMSAQIGESAYLFIEKFAKKRQVLLMSDGDGNILLARTPKDDERLNTVLTSSPGYQAVILSAVAIYDDTKRFYRYAMKSQSNVVSNGIVEDVHAISNDKIVSVSATAYDEAIRHTRVFNLMTHDDSYNSQADLQERATSQANYNRATGFKYTVTVQGFSPINDPARIWQPNQLILVNDDYCNIPKQLLLIKSVEFNYSIAGGSMTTLELIDKEGYSVETLQGIKYRNRKKKKASGEDVNGGIISNLTPYKGI